MRKKFFISVLLWGVLCFSSIQTCCITIEQGHEQKNDAAQQITEPKAEYSFLNSDVAAIIIPSFTAMAIMLVSYKLIDCLCGRYAEDPEKTD